MATAAKAGAYGKLDVSVKAVGDVANVRIIGELYNGWSEELFRSELDDARNSGAKNISLYINSIGGSVFAASEIVNIINEFIASTGGTVVGKGGAIVASAATFIAVHCSSFTMASNGQFMIHKPRSIVSGTADQLESAVKLLKNLETQYADAYAKKTGMTSDDVRALYATGDYWMTASEASKSKFIDGVDGDAQIDKDTQDMYAACGRQCPAPNNNNNNPKSKMELPLVIAALHMSPGSTQEQVMARIIELKAAESELKALKRSKEDSDAAAKSQRVEAAVNKAITDKKIHADAKDYFITKLTASSDLDAAIAELEAMKAAKSITDGITESPSGDGNTIPAERAAWTFAEWNEKDPDGLKALAAENEEAYLKLYNAHFKTNRKTLK